MKRCPECQQGYGNEMFYCLNDGCYLSTVGDSELTQAAPTRVAKAEPPPTVRAVELPKTLAEVKFREAHSPPPAKRRFPYAWVLISLGAVIALGMWAYIAYDASPQSSKTATSLPTSTPYETPVPTRGKAQRGTAYTPQPTPTPYEQPTPRPAIPIVPQFVSLGAGQWKSYGFTVGAGGGRVFGEFAARGGLGDDMYVIVMPASEMASYQNNYPYRANYNSGKVTGSGSLNVPLAPGTYQVVIRSGSTWTGRNIRTSISLELY